MDDERKTLILYMEDDAGLARLLKKHLERRGYGVDIASNGGEGLEMARRGSYDLLLVDYNMPVKGGLEVIRALSSSEEAPPAIMVTGNGSEGIAVEAMKSGAADYIVKDVDMGYLELLPIVIEQVLYKRQLILERRHAEEEKERLIQELRAALAKVKTLSGLLPICACCKKIRDDKGYWNQIEAYVSEHSDAEFTHGYCPDCAEQLYPEYYRKKKEDREPGTGA